jgi:hypothetical protein
MGATGLLAGGSAAAIGSAIDTTGAAASAATTTPDWLNVTSSTYDGGADPTGTNDSTGAFAAAIDAAAAGSVIYIPAGTYKISSTLTCTTVPVYFVGDGAWASIIEFTGSKDCFRVYDDTTYGDRTRWGGGFIGITIDGAKASTTVASTGLHVGDLLQYELDLTVQNFTTAGSIGVHLDNNYYWTEQLYGRIYAQNCASHVVFDWTSATASTSSGSFERCDLDVYIDQDDAAFDGVVLRNGAFITNGSMKIRGNFGSSTTSVSSAALHLTGYQSVNGYSGGSGIIDSSLDIGVECGSGDYTPQTIVFGSSENSISGCVGLLNFGAAGNKFTESNNDGNIFNFMGQVGGDSTLPLQWATYSSGFPAGVSGHVAFRSLPTGNEVMVSWAFAIAADTALKAGETIVAIDSRFAWDDNKVIPGNNAGSDLTGNVYAPAYITSKGSTADPLTPYFQYAGPAYEGSGSSYWYGQGVYTLSLG